MIALNWYFIGVLVNIVAFIILNRIWFNTKYSYFGLPSIGDIIVLIILSWVGLGVIFLIFCIDLSHTSIENFLAKIFNIGN
jgi:hypothetical protein